MSVRALIDEFMFNPVYSKMRERLDSGDMILYLGIIQLYSAIIGKVPKKLEDCFFHYHGGKKVITYHPR